MTDQVIQFVVDAEGNYLGKFAGAIPDGAIVVPCAPDDPRQTWGATQWLPLAPEFVNSDMDAKRAVAYREEADPLFFKSQRGEITQQVWLDKVNEIKTRYPKETV